MLHKTRCKFYVSARTVNSTQPFDGQLTSQSATVKLNAAYSPDQSTENYSFWSATPTGTATLYLFKEEHFKDYTPGSFWYIDIWEAEDGDWKIKKLEQYDFNINVEICDDNAILHGGNKIELSITNKNAWSIFEEGKKYKVEFLPAVKS